MATVVTAVDFVDLITKLAPVNGALEVGIATGVDPSIEDADKLRLFEALIAEPGTSNGETIKLDKTGADRTNRMRAMMSASWAFNHFHGEFRNIYANAAFAAVYWDMVATDDGDSLVVDIRTAPSLTAAEQTSLTGAITQASLAMAATLIVATKINWWSTNHHVGTPVLSGYAKKTALAVLPVGAIKAGGDHKDIATMMRTIGHWCSTRRVLRKLGVRELDGTKGIKVYPESASEDGAVVTLNPTADAAQRIDSMPAGTHRHAVAEAIIRRLALHYMAPYSPVINDCPGILRRCRSIRAHPACHHVGAVYLTGSRVAEFVDAEADAVLGRLVSFVRYFFPKSTICSSPHIMKSGAFISDYADYDANYDRLCSSVKQAGVMGSKEATKLAKLLGNAVPGIASYAGLRDVYAELDIPGDIPAPSDDVVKLLGKKDKLAMSSAVAIPSKTGTSKASAIVTDDEADDDDEEEKGAQKGADKEDGASDQEEV